MKKALIAFLLIGGAGAGTAQAQQNPVVQAPALGPNATLLSITAEGQSRRTPDLAMFNAGVVTQGKTAGEALSANAARMDAVIAALKRAGIADRDIQTSSLSLQPRYSDPERDRQIRAREQGVRYSGPAEPEAPKIVGYDARNSVQVRVRKLTDMGRTIDTLIAAGANQVDGPSFTLDDPQAALDEARTQAVERARQRAELYAKAAGMRVVRIISMAEGGGHYPVQQDIMVTAARSYAAAPPPPPSPVAPGELSLSVSLSVQFALER